ncbi:hypothetical protein [Streptomyces sp. NPDC058664]|uniref:hypothetical protein n=1 Tax=unclassified Streptomyces TaxID=2593676 RepID=UPI0036485FE4
MTRQKPAGPHLPRSRRTRWRSLEEDPGRGRLPPGTDILAVEVLPEQTDGRGISVVYRHDAVLMPWLIVSP